MNSLTALLAAEHLNDLLREANRARLATLADRDEPARPAAWRRLGGRGARRLSSVLGTVAVRLDPQDRGHVHATSETRTARSFAA